MFFFPTKVLFVVVGAIWSGVDRQCVEAIAIFCLSCSVRFTENPDAHKLWWWRVGVVLLVFHSNFILFKKVNYIFKTYNTCLEIYLIYRQYITILRILRSSVSCLGLLREDLSILYDRLSSSPEAQVTGKFQT